MNATKAQLKTQFNRARASGWLSHFEEAVRTHTSRYFDVADLLGIASRETNLNPKYLTNIGDNGNGFGLMQIDRRSFPDWTKTGKWKDARAGILKGAEVLMQKWADVQSSIGVKRGVRSSKTGKTSYFVGKPLNGLEAQQVTIASYNAGRWAHYSVSNGGYADQYTTGRDYSSDVMARAKVFRTLLNDSKIPTAVPAKHTPAKFTETKAEQLPAIEPPPETFGEPAATPAPVIEVQQISATPTEPQGDAPKEDTLTKIGNKFNALWTLVGTTIVAVITFLISTPIGIAISIIAATAFVGVVYMAISTFRATRKENREHDARIEREKWEANLKIERERQAFELTKLSMQSTMRQDLNSVTIASPPPTELAHSDSESEAVTA